VGSCCCAKTSVFPNKPRRPIAQQTVSQNKFVCSSVSVFIIIQFSAHDVLCSSSVALKPHWLPVGPGQRPLPILPLPVRVMIPLSSLPWINQFCVVSALPALTRNSATKRSKSSQDDEDQGVHVPLRLPATYSASVFCCFFFALFPRS